MRTDIHDGPEQPLQSEAGYIDARPQCRQIDKTSCDARPDHTNGSVRWGPSPHRTISLGFTAADVASNIARFGLRRRFDCTALITA